jgi:hypothetical protein
LNNSGARPLLLNARSENRMKAMACSLHMGGAGRVTMRTTLTVDDDVLEAARQIAVRENKSLGEIVSELARRGLKAMPPAEPRRTRNGVPLLVGGTDASPVTPELIKQLFDEHA